VETYQTAQRTYARPQAPVRTPRSIEYDLIARTTQRLRAAWVNRKHDYSALVVALDDNTRVWMTLAMDVADPGNALPAQLRAQLFYLYEFTAAHSRRIREGDGSVEVFDRY
jgi:flagellar biosynthesis activator protein FlaF